MTYPGGKGRIYHKIISMIPPHRVYVETHLGGGAIMRAKRPAAISFGIDVDPQVLESWEPRRFAGLNLIHQDAVEWLREFDFSGDEFVYCDPPYPAGLRRSMRVYRHEPAPRGHVDLLGVLATLSCHVMVSCYPNVLYDRMLVGWRRITIPAPSRTGLRNECIWTNYDPPTVLHDHAYIGETFREREAIRRRRATIMDRFRRLSPAERAALLSEMADEDPHTFSGLIDRVGMDGGRTLAAGEIADAQA